MQVVENESVTGGAGVGTKGHRVLPHSTLGAIVRGGALCGVLDITAAFVVYGGLFGVNPVLILQGIASGILGRSALDGGYPVALLGLLLHFFIAFTATFVYVQLSRWVSLLVQHVYVSGPLYGVVVYFFMGYIVVPLSAHSKGGAFSFNGDDHRGGHSHFLRGATDIFDNSAILAHVTSPEHLAMAVAFLAASQLVVGLIVAGYARRT